MAPSPGQPSVDRHGRVRIMGRSGGGVSAASETSIQISFTYRGEVCRERIRGKPTPANLKKATHFRGAILLAIDNGTFDYAQTFPEAPRRFKFAKVAGGGETVQDYLESWIDAKKSQLKDSTWANYSNCVRHRLVATLGAPVFVDVRKVQVEGGLLTMGGVGVKR